MHITKIEYNSPEYRIMLTIRDEVLRKPLGIELDLSKLGNEASDYLIACYEEETMIGCVVLSPLDRDRVKLRQMAVIEDFRGYGIGTEIVGWSEIFLRHKGFKFVEMNARKYAVPFYEKLGYKVEGDEFIEVTVPHYKMSKAL